MFWSISAMLDTFVEEECSVSASVESWEKAVVGGAVGLAAIDAFGLCLTVGLRGRDVLGGRLRDVRWVLP